MKLLGIVSEETHHEILGLIRELAYEQKLVSLSIVDIQYQIIHALLGPRFATRLNDQPDTVIPGGSMTPRDYLNWLNQAGKNSHPAFWINVLRIHMQGAIDSDQGLGEHQRGIAGFVITDIQSADQAAWVRTEAGRIWHISDFGYADYAQGTAGIPMKSQDMKVSSAANDDTINKLLSEL